jgi:RNAse (barnase) inhibitor barstar
MAEKPVYIIDGANFSNFEGFVEECNRGFIRAFGGEWSGNLNAFNDYFSWGEGDYIVVWKHFERARSSLGRAYFDVILGIIRDQRNVELRLESAQ